MNNRLEFLLKVLTIPLLIFPLVPMTLMAVLFSLGGPFGLELKKILTFLYLSGGVLGVTGLILALFSVRTNLVFLLLVVGSISYGVLLSKGFPRESIFVKIYICIPFVLAFGYSYLILKSSPDGFLSQLFKRWYQHCLTFITRIIKAVIWHLEYYRPK